MKGPLPFHFHPWEDPVSDMFSVSLRQGLFNRRSVHREIRLYLLAIYAHRKGDTRREDHFYYRYLTYGRKSFLRRPTPAGALD